MVILWHDGEVACSCMIGLVPRICPTACLAQVASHGAGHARRPRARVSAQGQSNLTCTPHWLSVVPQVPGTLKS